MKITQRQFDILALLVVMLIFLVMYGAVATADFWAKDDWEMLTITRQQPLHPQLADATPPEYTAYYDSLPDYAIQRELSIGRFRPVYWLSVTIEANLLRSNPRLWHIETLIIGLTTCVLFYIALRRLRLGISAALLGAAWLAVAGQNNWIELNVAEEPGMLMMIIAVNLFIIGGQQGRLTRWDWLALVVMVIAGWYKESFVLMIPAIILGRGILQWVWLHERPVWQTVRNLAPLVIVAAIACITQLALVYYAYRSGWYSSMVVGEWETLNPFSPLTWLVIVIFNLRFFSYFLPILAALPFILKLRTLPRRYTRLWLALMGMVAIALLPQSVLYANTGMFDNYLFPSAFIFALVGAAALHMLRTFGHPILHRAIVVVSLLLLMVGISGNTLRSLRYRADTVALTEAITTLNQQVTDESTVLHFSEGWLGLGGSLLTRLGEYGNQSVVYIEFDEDSDTFEQHQRWNGPTLLNQMFPILAAPEEIDIIFARMPVTTMAAKLPWYDEAAWDNTEITEAYEMPFMPDSKGEITYTVAVRRS